MAVFLMIRLIFVLIFLWALLPFFYIFKFLMIFYRYFSSQNIKGKVVLITGASSGIGKHLAYDYAKRGALSSYCSQEGKLASGGGNKSPETGSPDVLPICADVLKVDNCKRFVEEAVNHFGRLDRVVNNAGLGSKCLIEDATDFTKFEPVMDVNFWGSIYPTYFAIPHLKRTKGSIFVNASSTAILDPPGLGIYSASKAALISFYDTIGVELAPEISITIATLGVVESEMSKGKYLNGEGTTEINSDLANAFLRQLPVMSSSACAKSIVDAVCRKERYVTEPRWFRVLFLLKTLCPELIEFVKRICYLWLKARVAKTSSMPPSENKSD